MSKIYIIHFFPLYTYIILLIGFKVKQKQIIMGEIKSLLNTINIVSRKLESK